MNTRIRDKQAAYLAAMGREPAPAEDPRGANVVDIRPPGAAESDEVRVTYDNPRRVVIVRAKTTRAIVGDICRALGLPAAQLIATPTKQGDFHSAWIKLNDGGDDAGDGAAPRVAAPGQRLAFVTGLTPTVINIVLGHPIPRVEPIPGQNRNFVRFVPIGGDLAQAARAQAATIVSGGDAQPTPADQADAPVQAEPETFPEPDLSGDDE